MKSQNRGQRMVRSVAAALLLSAGPLLVHASGGQGKSIQIPMSDGVKLAADLYLPDGDGPFPFVLLRTPYGRAQLASYLSGPLNAEGIGLVAQDVRGMGSSEGMFIPFIHEKKDGLDTLSWIAKQEWCDGKIGMWGASYLGYCALILAPEQHAAFKAIVNISGWGNTQEMVSPGGAMHLQMGLPWTLSGQIRGRGSISQIDWNKAFRHIPVTETPSSLGIESAQWQGAVELYTGDFLDKTSGIASGYDRVRTPIFHMTGWYDMIARHTIDVYEGIDQAGGGRRGAVQKLMVGAWRHDQQWGTETKVGDEDFGPASAMGMDKVVKLSVRWFDHHLNGATNGVAREKPVKLFVMGPNEWRSYDQWPPGGAKMQKWFFDSTNGANGLDGDGSVSTTAPDSDGSDSFVFDPMDPVPTLGGANSHFFLKTLGIRDQRPAEKRKDVLVYTSDELAKPLTIIGPLQAVVYAATEGRHADITAKLVEVRADGYARVIDDGIKRGPDGAPVGRIEAIEPGRVYRYTINLGKTAITIPKGHRLRVEIASSNFPKYTRNPNTGESPESATVFEKVTQTVLHSSEYPSHVVLPVLK